MLYANRVWGRPVLKAKFYRLKLSKKLTNLNRNISVITDIEEKWFVMFEYAINHLSFGYVLLTLYLNAVFLFSFFFHTFFLLFLTMLSTFRSLNALYSKFERLEISGRTFVRLKSEVPGWGIPLNRVLKYFRNEEILKIN